MKLDSKLSRVPLGEIGCVSLMPSYGASLAERDNGIGTQGAFYSQQSEIQKYLQQSQNLMMPHGSLQDISLHDMIALNK